MQERMFEVLGISKEDAEYKFGFIINAFKFGAPPHGGLASWEFIKSSLIDRENGEWFWSVRADGTVNRDDDKAGFWKCPYHNGRMCMEIIERAR